MGGGLMELVAYGAQDIYLTGNPQITFFKVVYRRHTNFSMESIQQTWLGTEVGSSFADSLNQSPPSVKCEAIISRDGDLLHRMYLELGVSSISGYGNGIVKANLSSKLIESVELQIGGQRIDKQSGTWMETWAELTEPNPDCSASKCGTTNNHAGTLFQKMSGMGGFNVANVNLTEELLFNVPLQFWFNRHPGLALPLIALQYHEVKVILKHKFNSAAGYGYNKNKLWCDYIYLDTDERRRFAQVSHEYLIEQVQEQSVGTADITNETLNFNHPVKELILCNMLSNGRMTTIEGAASTELKLVLNGADRFKERNLRYFTRTQVYQHHSGCSGLVTTSVADTGDSADAIGVYSFALKPEEHQPSGTCNFSRIDSAQLQKTSGTTDITHIFAVNYNVLRIMSGMGGLAYSN